MVDLQVVASRVGLSQVVELMMLAEHSELYARSKGQACPVCGDTRLDRAPPSWQASGEVTAWVGCESCRHVWMEIYHLSGYRDLEFSPLPLRQE